MKVDTQASGACRMKLIVKAEAAETRQEYEEIVSLYVNQGRLPGFRQGKAPRAIVERQYRREIDSDVRSRLIGMFYRRALTEAKITAVAVVDVTDVIFSPETGISFVAVVDVAPEFKLPKYKKIPLKEETPTVTNEQVEAQIDRLRNMLARFEDAPADYVLARGDLARIDYSATCDNKPLKELFADAARLAEGADFWAQVNEPEFIPGLALGLEGAKAGETREIKVKFEKDFHVEAVRGRKVVYTVQIKQARQRIMPVDADVCARVGMPDIETIRARTRADLQTSAENREKERQRNEVVEFLLKRTEFDLPESVVAEETNLTVRSMLRDVVGRGATREDIEKHRETILGHATTASKDRVRLRYILSRIAEEEKIEVTDAELDARLKLMAEQNRMPIEKLRETVEQRHGIEGLRTDIRAEKALDQLVEEAKSH